MANNSDFSFHIPSISDYYYLNVSHIIACILRISLLLPKMSIFTATKIFTVCKQPPGLSQNSWKFSRYLPKVNSKIHITEDSLHCLKENNIVSLQKETIHVSDDLNLFDITFQKKHIMVSSFN